MRSRAPAERAGRTFDSPADSRAVDRRQLCECVATHYAAVNATAEQLDQLTHDLAESTDWSGYHQADEQFPSAGGNGIRAGGRSSKRPAQPGTRPAS